MIEYTNSIAPEYRVKVGRGVPRLGFVGTRSSEARKESSSDSVNRHTDKAFRNQRSSKATPRFAVVGARVWVFVVWKGIGRTSRSHVVGSERDVLDIVGNC